MALDPVSGSEQGKTRPCLIVQRDSANRASPTTIICPLTAAGKERGNLLNVLVPASEGGLRKKILVICNQLRAVDRSRIRGPKLGVVSGATMALVDEGLRAILDLGE